MFNFLVMVILIENLKFGNNFGITNCCNNISISNSPQHQQYAKIHKLPIKNSNVPSAKNISSFGEGYDKAFKRKYIPTQASII